jgi:hypothetical protein
MEDSLSAAPSSVEEKGGSGSPLRCEICARKLGKSLFFVEETGDDVPLPRRSWVLCRDCNEAVHVQMEVAPVQSPVRLRVAVGMVATIRTPSARRARLGQLSDESWTRVFLWLLPITMLVHLAVIVVIAFFH